ncbi:MAG: transglycosylase SLT domain-containing protein [Desulfovibrio sp.]|jgi:membrane-bound lytic murein transglycosylase C|nr:transglycosylase SLT domain-containing protein [Desulfovibrio sp.]
MQTARQNFDSLTAWKRIRFSMTRAAALYACLALAAFCAGTLVCRAQQMRGPVSSPSHIRQPVNPNAREEAQTPDAQLALRPSRFAVERALLNSGRFPKREKALLPHPGEETGLPAGERPGTSPRLAGGRVVFRFLDGTAEIVPLGQSAAALAPDLPDPLQANYFAGARDFGPIIPALYGEEWDSEGFPLRWRRSPEALADGDILACTQDRGDGLLRLLVRGFRPARNGAGGMEEARFYKNAVSRYAEKYNLSPAMVLAVMHTESHFNPLAVSRNKAVGLMQIIPDSAGYEAHRYLTGSPGTPGLDILMSPEKNISYGTAYLHLLGRRYFGGVQNAFSRQICVIAAYNGGPKTVLRLFDPEDDKNAVERINSLNPEQLYTHLTTRMPNSETRRYVELVLGRMHSYSAY